MTPQSSSSQLGFTLVETLVALFVLAMVSAAGGALLLGATQTQKQVQSREQQTRQLDVAQAMIRNDIAALSIRAIRPDDGFSRPGNVFGEDSYGVRPFLSFVRSGWLNPGQLEARSQLQAVSYRLEDGQLIRSATLRPDATDATDRAEQVLLQDVEMVRTRFRRGGEWSVEWIGDAGQALNVVPDLIELEIVFANETRMTIAALTGGRS
ncbi:MAG: type II secretion system minor pseudopilin GspJ [Henriciella sp.]|nr:type II secretion system minor pseudopilin GspJ [Henriciella sp.]